MPYFPNHRIVDTLALAGGGEGGRTGSQNPKDGKMNIYPITKTDFMLSLNLKLLRQMKEIQTIIISASRDHCNYSLQAHKKLSYAKYKPNKLRKVK
jgi:hypothetical protein